MGIPSRPQILLLTLVLVLLFCMGACDDGEDTPSPTVTPIESPSPTATPTESPAPTEPAEDVTITIGSLTDKTGMASTALAFVDMALTDVVGYFNDNNLIPGVKLDTIFYDGQYDSANDIPGYHWLKEHGADLIITPVPSVPISLLQFLEDDEMVLFSQSATKEPLEPPGWVFSMGITPEDFVYTLMDWIAQNDWDYQTKGPAKVGSVGGMDAYALSLQNGLEAYCRVHPDQFEWVDGFMVEWTVLTYTPEIDALMDCDYVMAPSTGVQTCTFMKQFRETGGTARFLGTDAQAAFIGLIYSSVGWEDLDGMPLALSVRWWNEPGYELVDLTWNLLEEKHSDHIESAVFGGTAYIGTLHTCYGILHIIGETVKEVGAQNFTGRALYETAETFSMVYDGGKGWNFSPTRRTPWNYLGIYRASAAEEDLVRVGADYWHPVRVEP